MRYAISLLLTWMLAGVIASSGRTDASAREMRQQLPDQQPYFDQCNTHPRVKFAVVGDYGVCALNIDKCEDEAAVAALIRSKQPDFVISVGDNNYENGEPGTGNAHLEANIRVAQPPFAPDSPSPTNLYLDFIPGRFFAAMGNHDWRTDNANPTRSFHGIGTPTGVRVGPVELWVVDTAELNARPWCEQYGPGQEPDDCDGGIPFGSGVTLLDDQVAPLAGLIAASDACYKMLYMHVAPYSSGPHGQHDHPGGPVQKLRQFIADVDLQAGGGVLDAVFSGHDHLLQQSVQDVNGNPVQFIVSGAGGQNLHTAGPLVDNTLYISGPGTYGAAFVTIDGTNAFYSMLTAQEVNESASPWIDGWSFGEIGTWQESKPECTMPLYCTVIGACQYGVQIGTYLNNPYQRLPGYCGSPLSELVIDTPLPPVCPNPAALMSARLTVTVCYNPFPGCEGPYDGPCYCDILAAAYDCQGNLLWQGCANFNHCNIEYTFVSDTECIFDRFNLPCRWEIWVQSNWISQCWQLYSARVDYTCCDNCTPHSGGGGQG